MMSVEFHYKPDTIIFARSRSYKFFRRIIFLLAAVTTMFFGFDFFKANESKIQQTWSEKTFGATAAVGIGIFFLSGLLVLLIQLLKSTADHKISIRNDSIFIDNNFFCTISEPKEIVRIKNIDWRALGSSYTVGIKIASKKLFLLYYLSEQEAIVAEKNLQDFLATKTKSS